jgi:hypothetical protein
MVFTNPINYCLRTHLSIIMAYARPQMLMTAIDCKKRGITFTAVHDSYWTHACDVDTMSEALRDQFVDLYVCAPPPPPLHACSCMTECARMGSLLLPSKTARPSVSGLRLIARIDRYSMPLLENLRESLRIRFPMVRVI